MKINDKRHSLTIHPSKKYRKRQKSDIKKIAIHHSATVEGSAEAFARYHVRTLGWSGIGYHFVINKDGSIDWCNEFETISYHVGNSNSFSLGICLVGDFVKETPSTEQYEAAIALTRQLLMELELTPDDVLGHQQFPGYESKQCPSIDMDQFRSDLVLKNGWQKENGIWYYYENGKHKKGWIKYKNKWYYLEPQMKTGWLKYKNKWYYLHPNGDMATGLIIDNNKAYYLDTTGAMYANVAVNLRARPDGSLT